MSARLWPRGSASAALPCAWAARSRATRSSCSVRAGHGDRGRGPGLESAEPGPGSARRARERGDAARGARPARAPVQRPPAADLHALARARSSSTAPGPRSPPRRTRRAPRGCWLAETLGLRPFELADSARTLYHAGAVFASNYLVTLHRAASLLFESAGAPPEALEPLMRRTIENDFELTGPIARGDWATVEAHRAAIRAAHPSSSSSTRPSPAGRWRSRHEDRPHDRGAARRAARRGRARPDDGCAARRPSLALPRGAGGERARRRVALRERRSVRRAGRPRRLSARRGWRREARGGGRCRRPLRAVGRRDLSAGLRHVGRRRVERRGRRGARRSFPRRRDRVREALQHRAAAARVLRPEGRAAGGRDPARRARPEPRRADPRAADRPRRRRPRALLAQRATLQRRARPSPSPSLARSLRARRRTSSAATQSPPRAPP